MHIHVPVDHYSIRSRTV